MIGKFVFFKIGLNVVVSWDEYVLDLVLGVMLIFGSWEIVISICGYVCIFCNCLNRVMS